MYKERCDLERSGELRAVGQFFFNQSTVRVSRVRCWHTSGFRGSVSPTSDVVFVYRDHGGVGKDKYAYDMHGLGVDKSALALALVFSVPIPIRRLGTGVELNGNILSATSTHVAL